MKFSGTKVNRRVIVKETNDKTLMVIWLTVWSQIFFLKYFSIITFKSNIGDIGPWRRSALSLSVAFLVFSAIASFYKLKTAGSQLLIYYIIWYELFFSFSFTLCSTARVILYQVVYGWRNQCILVGQHSAL